MTFLKTILVPTDFSDSAAAALDYAVRLGQGPGHKVYLLHVYSVPVVPMPEGMTLSAALLGNIVTASEDALRTTAQRHREGGAEIHTILRNGDPRDVILATAKEIGADLICIGTHGRRGFSRALMGSIAEGVLRRSRVPVLTVRAPSKAEKLTSEERHV